MTYRFDPTQGLIIVPVRLFGPAGDMIVRLALDTGATSTLINSEIIVLLGYDPATSPDRIQVTTGSGSSFVLGFPFGGSKRWVDRLKISLYSHIRFHRPHTWTDYWAWTSFAVARSV
jgi:Aspartyl protease